MIDYLVFILLYFSTEWNAQFFKKVHSLLPTSFEIHFISSAFSAKNTNTICVYEVI